MSKITTFLYYYVVNFSCGKSRLFMNAKTIRITTPYITLGQLLKLANIIGNGGEAKVFLLEHDVLVNGESDRRRGRKLYPGDEVSVLGKAFAIAS